MIDLYQEQERQRFVDGELTIEEENEAIIQCELDPELWRTTGLAMIEQRRIAKALASIGDNELPNAVPLGAVELPRKTSTPSALRHPWISLAASLLLTVSFSALAYQAGQRSTKRQSAVSVAKGNAAKSGASETVNHPGIDRVEYSSDRQIAFGNESTQTSYLINAEVREALRKVGYGVDEKLEWEVQEDGDGMKIIPNHQVCFVSLKD